jgi:hypothetical protein
MGISIPSFAAGSKICRVGSSSCLSDSLEIVDPDALAFSHAIRRFLLSMVSLVEEGVIAGVIDSNTKKVR